MKKSIVCFAAFLSAILFSGCSSLPEPSEKNRTLLYANTEYFGAYTVGGNESAEVKKQISGITVKIKNIATKKTYTLVSNAKGEIIRANLPEGTYIIAEISSEFEYDGRNWVSNCVPRTNDVSAYFKIRPGVVNLGVIHLQINFDDGWGRVSWMNSPEVAQSRFEEIHFDSWWIAEDWFTMIESRQ